MENEKRIDKLIIVPHQDDEVLLFGGVIQQALLDGESLKVVMVTNGDYGCSSYEKGCARLRESIAGLGVLGD